MTLPLSKTLDPADFDQLAEELAIVDRYFTSARPQHPMRRWEYAMALRAMTQWLGEGPNTRQQLVDIGGDGSPFASIVGERCWHPDLIDPVMSFGRTLAQELTHHPCLADVVTCLSVLEHVTDLDRFCYHLSCLVAPGGLLFLTMDYCDGFALAREGFLVPDTYDLHWMRERIFNQFTLKLLVGQFLKRDFSMFGGGLDLIWHGPQVSDYTFASLALVKRV